MLFCGHSLEALQQGTFNKYPQQVFMKICEYELRWLNIKIINIGKRYLFSQKISFHFFGSGFFIVLSFLQKALRNLRLLFFPANIKLS